MCIHAEAYQLSGSLMVTRCYGALFWKKSFCAPRKRFHSNLFQQSTSRLINSFSYASMFLCSVYGDVYACDVQLLYAFIVLNFFRLHYSNLTFSIANNYANMCIIHTPETTFPFEFW